jgi:hypothetical protein
VDEVGHTHIWWHYWIDHEGRLVWDNPFESKSEDYESDGYACFCGASPPGGAP